jgi:hypothetical protein
VSSFGSLSQLCDARPPQIWSPGVLCLQMSLGSSGRITASRTMPEARPFSSFPRAKTRGPELTYNPVLRAPKYELRSSFGSIRSELSTMPRRWDKNQQQCEGITHKEDPETAMALHGKEKKEPEFPFYAFYGKDPRNHHGCCRAQKRATGVEGLRGAVYIAALYLAVLALGFACSTAHAQTNEWVWMGGGANQRGVYGTLGTPAPGNIPGNQSGMANWKDNKGNFWLFGGDGADSAGTGGLLNDLWKFNPATLEWTWVSGSSVLTPVDFMGSQDFVESGVYGTLGTPAAGNVPGGRNSPAAWADGSGNLWLFGGYGSISTGYIGFFNDLWEFNPSTLEWTWMGGSNTIPTNTGGEAGVYGTLGTPAAGNTPGARYEAVSWTDNSGNLLLFGGDGFDSAGDQGILNDLWKFNPSTDQ